MSNQIYCSKKIQLKRHKFGNLNLDKTNEFKITMRCIGKNGIYRHFANKAKLKIYRHFANKAKLKIYRTRCCFKL